ncbi:hypothetical protein [Neorhizobium sp. T6_25]|uniref:hypothetical protein n=1 Tax=Neorhizobium sp. T6_25 TaxID=2093833 RepID=UPI000CF8799E|nr:hypothetical protein [Neorhizobium sp. T6_25]
MIDVQEILQLVDEHEFKTGETMTELSRRATGSTETIRNWKRSLKEGKDFSAKFDYVQAVLEAMGHSLILRDAPKKISGEVEVKRLLAVIDGLPTEAVNPVWRMIDGYIKDAEQSPGSQPHDRSEPASRRRVPTP